MERESLCTLMALRNPAVKILFHICISPCLVAQMVENLPAMQETQLWSLVWEDPLEREWQPPPIFLPGEFHGQGLMGYSPWGHKESDMTEQHTHTHTHTHIHTHTSFLNIFFNRKLSLCFFPWKLIDLLLDTNVQRNTIMEKACL